MKIRELWEKYKKSILVFAVCAFLGIAMELSSGDEKQISEDGSLQRKAAGEGEGISELVLSLPEIEEETEYTVSVPEQKLTESERDRYFKMAEEEIDESFLGGNPDLEHIFLPVSMKESFCGGIVEGEWILDDYSLVNPNGTLVEKDIPKEGAIVGAKVNLTYGDYEHIYEFSFRVCQRKLSASESVYRELDRYFEAEGGKEGEERVKLPTEAAGMALVWSEKQGHTGILFLFLGVLAGGMIQVSGKSKENKERKERERLLMIDYPEIVNKLSLLLGAGMTVQAAWERIVITYDRQHKKKRDPPSPAYAEMQVTLREMKDGMAERSAYERFGERCCIRPYRKLSALIVQNLRKGSKGLTKLLEAEADDAFEVRKNLAKRLGDEAGTKLLGPMIMSLGIVVVIIMVPAVISFYK